MSRLAGKVAVVTGGGSGIGRGIVLAMAREGADIAIPDIHVLHADKVAEEVKALGRHVLAMKCDVTSSADVKTMVDRTRDQLGKIDILVNNAGMAAPPGMPFTNNTEDDWDRAFAVNTKSVFLTCKSVAPHFIERKGGRIINIASIAGPLAATTMAVRFMCDRKFSMTVLLLVVGVPRPRRPRAAHVSCAVLSEVRWRYPYGVTSRIPGSLFSE